MQEVGGGTGGLFRVSGGETQASELVNGGILEQTQFRVSDALARYHFHIPAWPGLFLPLCFEDECLEKYPHDYAGGSAADAEGDPAEPPGAFGQAQSGIGTGGSQEFMSFFMKTAILLIHTIGPYDQ